jgi:hypothetical protein
VDTYPETVALVAFPQYKTSGFLRAAKRVGRSLHACMRRGGRGYRGAWLCALAILTSTRSATGRVAPNAARRGVSNLSESMHGALAALVRGKSRRGLAVIGVHRMVMTLVAVGCTYRPCRAPRRQRQLILQFEIKENQAERGICVTYYVAFEKYTTVVN